MVVMNSCEEDVLMYAEKMSQGCHSALESRDLGSH